MCTATSYDHVRQIRHVPCLFVSRGARHVVPSLTRGEFVHHDADLELENLPQQSLYLPSRYVVQVYRVAFEGPCLTDLSNHDLDHNLDEDSDRP